MSAGTVEDGCAGGELEQLEDLLDVLPRALGVEDALVEVEVVLVEDALEIELVHASLLPNSSSSMWISPTRSKPSRSRIGRDIEPPCVISAGVPFATASCQRA
jgi:hypothetical protein